MNWTKVVKNAMNTAIPKASNKYIYLYQLKTTPQIRDLESQFKTLKELATHSGRTTHSYREYHRIKTEVREM